MLQVFLLNCISHRANNIHQQSLPEKIVAETDYASSFTAMVAGFKYTDPQEQLFFVTTCRTALWKERDPYIVKAVECGLVPELVTLLTKKGHPWLQFIAELALTHIVKYGMKQQPRDIADADAPLSPRDIFDADALAFLIALLASPYQDIYEKVVWALGYIAGTNTELRDTVLKAGVLPSLLSGLLWEPEHVEITRMVTWTLSNLCSGKIPAVELEAIQLALVPLAQLLLSTTDSEVLINVASAFSNISHGGYGKIDAVLKIGIVSSFSLLLAHTDTKVVTPVLRTFGNLVTGNDYQTQYVLEHCSLAVFCFLLGHDSAYIRKEASWTLSNITAGTSVQIQYVIDAFLIPPLVACMNDKEVQVQKEATWALCNAVLGGNEEQVRWLVRKELCVKALCDGLTTMKEVIKVIFS